MLLGDSVINVEIISLKHYYCLTESMCVSRADVDSIAALTCLSSDLEVVAIKSCQRLGQSYAQ